VIGRRRDYSSADRAAFICPQRACATLQAGTIRDPLQEIPFMRNLKPSIALAALTVLGTLASTAAVAASDPVVLRFATVGDSRQDPKKADATQLDPQTGKLSGQDAHWLQNSKAFGRILREVGAQHPSLLFFNGDMIMGYGRAGVPTGWATTPPTADQVGSSDIGKFIAQYAFWRGMVTPLIESGTYVVPVPGNHEVQCNSANQTDAYNQLTCASGKHAQAENEVLWSANMGDLIVDANRFQNLFAEKPTNVSYNSVVPGLDGETTDQSKLTYSFDFRGSHFVVINTDPVGVGINGGSLDSHAPTQWLAQDLAAAASRGNTHFFVFGHKPAYTYDYSGTGAVTGGGLDVDLPARDAFWNVIEQYGATYFCGHEHTTAVARPNRKAAQVLVGSGGSPFDVAKGTVSVNPATDRDYAWASVEVHQSGEVEVTLRGFNESFGPSSTIGKLELRH
jgi:hypothetical protein